MNNYYMSIGYPIGLGEKDNGETYYNVELSGDLVGLPCLYYDIWKYCFFDIKKYNDIINYFNKYNFTKDQIDKGIDELKNYKVLIELDPKNFDYLYDKLKILTPLRNGFGIGINKEKKQAIVINQKQEFKISLSQYNIWAICDNRIMVKDIIEKYAIIYNIDKEKIKTSIINDLLYLKTIDLLRFNRREKNIIIN